ncbi:lipoyl protein ligase domain-containing protein [Deferrisoma sp.]
MRGSGAPGVRPIAWDEDLLAAEVLARGGGVRVWPVTEVAVVLGRSGRPEAEVFLDRCRADRVPVYRRRGGGGTVVLAPGCWVVSVSRPLESPVGVGRLLRRTVEVLAEVAGGAAGLRLAPRGTGDLCAGERKVLGSSAFARRGGFLYQASLLVEMDLDLVDRYLPHPPREPAYRRGRPHREFLTTLRTAGFRGDADRLAQAIEAGLRARQEEIG